MQLKAAIEKFDFEHPNFDIHFEFNPSLNLSVKDNLVAIFADLFMNHWFRIEIFSKPNFISLINQFEESVLDYPIYHDDTITILQLIVKSMILRGASIFLAMLDKGLIKQHRMNCPLGIGEWKGQTLAYLIIFDDNKEVIKKIIEKELFTFSILKRPINKASNTSIRGETPFYLSVENSIKYVKGNSFELLCEHHLVQSQYIDEKTLYTKSKEEILGLLIVEMMVQGYEFNNYQSYQYVKQVMSVKVEKGKSTGKNILSTLIVKHDDHIAEMVLYLIDANYLKGWQLDYTIDVGVDTGKNVLWLLAHSILVNKKIGNLLSIWEALANKKLIKNFILDAIAKHGEHKGKDVNYLMIQASIEKKIDLNVHIPSLNSDDLSVQAKSGRDKGRNTLWWIAQLPAYSKLVDYNEITYPMLTAISKKDGTNVLWQIGWLASCGHSKLFYDLIQRNLVTTETLLFTPKYGGYAGLSIFYLVAKAYYTYYIKEKLFLELIDNSIYKINMLAKIFVKGGGGAIDFEGTNGLWQLAKKAAYGDGSFYCLMNRNFINISMMNACASAGKFEGMNTAGWLILAALNNLDAELELAIKLHLVTKTMLNQKIVKARYANQTNLDLIIELVKKDKSHYFFLLVAQGEIAQNMLGDYQDLKLKIKNFEELCSKNLNFEEVIRLLTFVVSKNILVNPETVNILKSLQNIIVKMPKDESNLKYLKKQPSIQKDHFKNIVNIDYCMAHIALMNKDYNQYLKYVKKIKDEKLFYYLGSLVDSHYQMCKEESSLKILLIHQSISAKENYEKLENFTKLLALYLVKDKNTLSSKQQKILNLFIDDIVYIKYDNFFDFVRCLNIWKPLFNLTIFNESHDNIKINDYLLNIKTRRQPVEDLDDGFEDTDVESLSFDEIESISEETSPLAQIRYNYYHELAHICSNKNSDKFFECIDLFVQNIKDKIIKFVNESACFEMAESLLTYSDLNSFKISAPNLEEKLYKNYRLKYLKAALMVTFIIPNSENRNDFKYRFCKRIALLINELIAFNSEQEMLFDILYQQTPTFSGHLFYYSVKYIRFITDHKSDNIINSNTANIFTPTYQGLIRDLKKSFEDIEDNQLSFRR